MLRSPVTALVLALSLASVACSAETSTSGPDAPGMDGVDAPSAAGPREILPLSGEAGVAAATGFVSEGATEVGSAALGAAPVANLLVKDSGATYEVLSFELGIEGGAAIVAGAGASATRPTLSPVKLRLRAKPGMPALGANLYTGSPVPWLHLVPAAAGLDPKAAFAVLEYAVVRKSTFEATEDGNVEVVELAPMAETIVSGKTRMRYDGPRNAMTCEGDCACGKGATARELGPFTQTQSASWPVAAGSTPIESVKVMVSQSGSTSYASGSTSGTTRLDEHTISGMFGPSGLCAMWQVATTALAPRLTVDVASPVSATSGTPATDTRFEACTTGTLRVKFTSAPSGTRQTIGTTAAGIVRTDNVLDANGKLVEAKVSGWSFVKGAPIKTCAEAVPF